VNPVHGSIARPFERVAAELAATSGARFLPPRALLRELVRAGRFARRHVEAAVAEAGPAGDERDHARTVEALLASLHEEQEPLRRLPLVTDLADRHGVDSVEAPWSVRVVDEIARFAETWFDRGQASWSPDRRRGLYRTWRARLAADRGVVRRAQRASLRASLAQLPSEPWALLQVAVDRLGLDAAMLSRIDYCGALLGTVRGWAGFCAHERWQARLRGGDDASLVELLAVRLAWEVLLLDLLQLGDQLPQLHRAWLRHPHRIAAAQDAQRDERLLLRAAEIAFQSTMIRGFAQPFAAPAAPAAVAVAAVFCIDVRSERFRRALERASGDAVATHGFAGFFGLPMAMTPLGTGDQRPQLPGLFAPAVEATERAAAPARTAALALLRGERLALRSRWSAFRSGPGSCFAFVETSGLWSLGSLLGESLGCMPPDRSEEAGLTPRERGELAPCWHGATATEVGRSADLAAAALRGIGLLRDFPPLVLLVGHGASTRNNAHAAALDCGACGGHSGRDNARLLARTLEGPAVRVALRQRGIDVPVTTRFVAALHDTTTDEVTVFDADGVDPAALAQLRTWLDQAGASVRAERAPALGLAPLARRPEALRRALQRRAADWAQVRPEWALADNAALVFAPRSRTRQLDLGGRVFLHDYHANDDADGSLLAQLLHAPMQVAAWINLQYYASVVDPTQFGSGDKVLHDVVGGRLGVREGQGGDLRFGLPRQSVHDGTRWRHTPIRLSVFVAADAERIERALATSEPARQLVENGWLHLFRVDEDGACWRRQRTGGFVRQLPTVAAGERTPTQARGPAGSDRAGVRLRGQLATMVVLVAAIVLRAWATP
jgi:uncharacterized protein YbcC (UPF0753/DUF2309 family)